MRTPPTSHRLRLVDFDAVAAAGLGAIEVGVGARQRHGRIFLSYQFRHSGRHRDAAGIGDGEVLHVLAHAFGEDSRAGQPDVGQQHQELLAAPAHRQIRSALRGREDLGDAAQHAVADGVSRAVVDVLEPIDVKQHEAQRRTRATGARHLARQRLFAAAAIGQRGHRIGQRETRQRRETLVAVHAFATQIELEREPATGFGQRVERARIKRQWLDVEQAERAGHVPAGRLNGHAGVPSQRARRRKLRARKERMLLDVGHDQRLVSLEHLPDEGPRARRRAVARAPRLVHVHAKPFVLADDHRDQHEPDRKSARDIGQVAVDRLADPTLVRDGGRRGWDRRRRAVAPATPGSACLAPRSRPRRPTAVR